MDELKAWLKKNGFTWKTAVIFGLTLVAVILIGSLCKHYNS